MRRWILLSIFAVSSLASAVPARAGCTTDLADCYQAAANVDSFWYRWAAGLDCELAYAECVRIMLLGT